LSQRLLEVLKGTTSKGLFAVLPSSWEAIPEVRIQTTFLRILNYLLLISIYPGKLPERILAVIITGTSRRKEAGAFCVTIICATSTNHSEHILYPCHTLWNESQHGNQLVDVCAGKHADAGAEMSAGFPQPSQILA
jgi:hypothetical protein